jgi:hypothetical protein
MPGKIKAAVSIAVIAIVLAGGYYVYISNKVSTPAPQTATNTATPQDTNTGPTLPSGSDTSDAALQKDVASVDADMSAMAGDSASIDSGMNDKAVPQN